MNTYIILLRGINVGGHKKIPMAELRDVLSKAGYINVKTYIQSGNIILQSSEEVLQNIEHKIHELIQDQFSFEVPVLARTRNQLEKIFHACPFSKEKKENSYFVLFSEVPDKALVDEVSQISYDNEEFVIIKDCLYFHSSVGYGRTKFNMNMFEKKLHVKATSRNYKTMLRLIAMSSENEKDH